MATLQRAVNHLVAPICLQVPFYSSPDIRRSLQSAKMAKTLRDIRTEKALSQAELAEKAKISERTLSRIELRHTSPRPSTRRRIAAALGVKPEEIEW